MIIRLNNVRLSFPWLWKMQQPAKGGDGKPAFSAQFLLAPTHPQFKQLQDAIEKVAVETWGAQGIEILKGLIAKDQVCLHNGVDKTAKYAAYAGMFYVSARSQVRPNVFHNTEIDPATGKLRMITEHEGKVYSGCYVNGLIDIYAVKSPKMWVTAQLMGVQYHADGDAFGGGRTASPDDFAAVSAEGTQLPAAARGGAWANPAADLAG